MLLEKALVAILVFSFLVLIYFKVDQNGAEDSLVTIQRFESTTRHDHQGVWGQPTATIDWCERNYVVSSYIAEFYNAISNIGLIVSGAHCIWQTSRFGWDARFAIAGLSIVVIGLGSAAYHSTLLYFAQLWDEVPMVWTVLVFIYINSRMARGHSAKLVLALALYGSIWTVVHSLGAYVVIFQLHFGMLGLFNLYLNCRVLRLQCQIPILPSSSCKPLHPARRDLRWIVWLVVVYTAAAFFLWIADQVACDALHRLPGGLPNPQLHAWWHLILSVSSHLLLQAAVITHQAAASHGLPRSRWVLGGFLPLALPEDKV